MVESGSAVAALTRPAPVTEGAARSWDNPAPAPTAESPSSPPSASPTSPASSASRSAPADPGLRDQARQSIRPTRTGNAVSADDDRDDAATRNDSDLEETTESHTELLARHLGAEIIAEEEHGA